MLTEVKSPLRNLIGGNIMRILLINAERMLKYERKSHLKPVRDCDQFFVLNAAPFFCVVDGAPIGPSYNPGHAHSDNFTFDLFFRNAPLVVDAGTFSYDVTPQRIASRSTAEHNTVVINGLEQSEAWGGFRVARRSNPTLSRSGRCGDHLVFQGQYTNRVDPSQRITHERIIIVRSDRIAQRDGQRAPHTTQVVGSTVRRTVHTGIKTGSASSQACEARNGCG